MSMLARKNRTNRRSWKSYALGAAAAAALLATTACEPDTADGAKSSDRPSATSATSSATSGSTASTETGGSNTEDSGNNGSEESGDSGDGSDIPLCTMKDLSVSAKNYDGKGEVARHILLTVTNTTDHKCDVQGAPEVTLGDAQGPARVKEETADDEPITLAPGDKAYAGLLATGGQMDTYDVKSMTLGLGSPGGESEAGPKVDVPMPVDSFPADDGQWVSYWAGTEGLAMRPVTQS